MIGSLPGRPWKSPNDGSPPVIVLSSISAGNGILYIFSDPWNKVDKWITDWSGNVLLLLQLQTLVLCYYIIIYKHTHNWTEKRVQNPLILTKRFLKFNILERQKVYHKTVTEFGFYYQAVIGLAAIAKL